MSARIFAICLFSVAAVSAQSYDNYYKKSAFTDSSCTTQQASESLLLGNFVCFASSSVTSYQTCNTTAGQTTLYTFFCSNSSLISANTTTDGACNSPSDPNFPVYSKFSCITDSSGYAEYNPKFEAFLSTSQCQSAQGKAVAALTTPLNQCFKDEAQDPFQTISYSSVTNNVTVNSNCADQTCASCSVSFQLLADGSTCQSADALSSEFGLPAGTAFKLTYVQSTTGAAQTSSVAPTTAVNGATTAVSGAGSTTVSTTSVRTTGVQQTTGYRTTAVVTTTRGATTSGSATAVVSTMLLAMSAMALLAF